MSVPTVSIGGFLGAGKTSLINNLLRNASGKRIVVFVNDFGAINIDYDLIAAEETDRISLANGCVCCTLNDDLVKSIVGFCEANPPDFFVIEASGVSNPKALDASLHALNRSGMAHMKKRLYLIDADQFGNLNYADTEDLIDHAAASDLIILNKIDLGSPQAVSDIEGLLAQSAPRSDCLKSSYGNVPAELIFGGSRICSDPSAVSKAKHDTKAIYESYSFANFEPLSQTSLENLTDEMSKTCLRAKGTVYLKENPQVPVQIQLVGTRVNIREIGNGPSYDPPPTRLVTIGWANQLDPSTLSDLLGTQPFD